ncbi:hypothetical protein AMELA_G00076880 [Ameiurus melas]|uniref:Uncharacterized protein n=1 Tax=Ameiurus melas TaxID=219545 RepID=A0A7J6B2N3_AMEME|nr:hypothetical protein AMELA_G00076880 [Ameiurus melas]
MNMRALVFLTVMSYRVVVSVSVLETTKDYSCQEGSQILKLEHANSATDCEQSWTAEGIPIGNFAIDTVECHSPCINVSAGEILINRCLNATLTIICDQGHVTESRIHFLGIQINPSPLQNFNKRDRYGIYACFLLLIFAGFAIICTRHRIRNTLQNHL